MLEQGHCHKSLLDAPKPHPFNNYFKGGGAYPQLIIHEIIVPAMTLLLFVPYSSFWYQKIACFKTFPMICFITIFEHVQPRFPLANIASSSKQSIRHFPYMEILELPPKNVLSGEISHKTFPNYAHFLTNYAILLCCIYYQLCSKNVPIIIMLQERLLCSKKMGVLYCNINEVSM